MNALMAIQSISMGMGHMITMDIQQEKHIM